MIETRHIAHVLALARHRNFSRAATEVCLTQSALSRSIQTLENQLGVRLFDRGRDGAEPTAFGELVVRRARRVAFEAPWFRFHHGFITRRDRTLPPLAHEFMRLVRSIEAELDEREVELWRESS
jgi:hypothetical protein